MSADPTPASQADILHLFRTWAALEVSGDLDAWLDHVDDEAVLQPPGEPAVEGKAAIRTFAQSFFSLPLVKMEPGDVRVVVNGDLACVYGPLTMGLEGPDGVTETTLKCLAVWRRNADRWRILVNSWSMNAAS